VKVVEWVKPVVDAVTVTVEVPAGVPGVVCRGEPPHPITVSSAISNKKSIAAPFLRFLRRRPTNIIPVNPLPMIVSHSP
jgi:hypothetical protein